MNDLPTEPPTIDPAPSTGCVSAIVSWLVIIAACVAMVYLQREMVDTREDVSQNDPQRENVILRMTSRYALGAMRITSSLPQAPGGAGGQQGLGAQFAAQLDASATRPVDYLRVAIVMGELLDKDAAIERLGRLAIAVTDESIAQDRAALTTIYTAGPDALTDQQRDGLLERHRWYGRLALTHGLPPRNPQRSAVMAPAMRTVIGALVFVLAALLAGMVGFVLLIVGLVMLAGGKLKRHYADHAPPTLRHPAMLETVAIFLVGLIGVSMLSAWIEARFDVDATGYVIWLLPLVLFWPRLRGMNWRDLRMAMGWHRGQGVFIEALCGVTGHIAGLPLLAVGVVFVILLSSFGYQPAHHPMVDELFGASWADVVLLYILACVWAPLVEESLFRGAFYHHLRRPIGAVLSAAVTGFIFAVIHPQGMIAVPALMSLGFTFAMLREWRGSLIAPMAAHAFNNCVAVTLMLLLLGG